MPRLLLILIAAWALLPAPAALAAPGTVTVPLATWQQLADQADPAPVDSQAPVAVVQGARTLRGSFERGVLEAELVSEVQVLPGQGHVRVPILGAGSTLRSVEVDGRATSALPDARGAMHTVGIDAPGRHVVRVRFYQGREDDRFGRRVALQLPPSGATRVSVLVPERDIDASLDGGVLVSAREVAGGTLLEGQLDALGALELTWRRQAHSAEDAADARLEARLHALFTLDEALVQGVADVAFTVQDGETDRLELVVPSGVEVLDVTGDAVLQWQTSASGDGRLTVLLRYLVEDAARLRVHFQFPAELSAPVTLRLPLPADDVPWNGVLGVQGPAGLQVEAETVQQAQALTLRDLPPELTGLSESPLLMGFSFDEEPLVRLRLQRNAAVELTSTIIDDLDASSVVIADGTEITKLRLRLRNNTRQYLGTTLPPGATLTHALIDGVPIRPALSGDSLLLPLPQSERIAADGQRYLVQPGDTLTGIASTFYGDASDWRQIQTANPTQLHHAFDLSPGQVLQIPPGDATVRESSVVVELAWRRDGAPLGPVGSGSLALPKLDVDVVEATWHLYLPHAIEPVHFSANLTQVSALRYGPVRRARQFLHRALRLGSAWAGGREYQSILSRRKAIYSSENRYRQGGQEALSSFPLVGERYRFERLLLGDDVPQVRWTHLDADVAWGLRQASLFVALGLGLLGLTGGRREKLLALGGFAGLLFVAHFVLGVHRRLLWGLDLALLLTLLRDQGPGWAAGLRRLTGRPRLLLDALSWRGAIGAFALLIAATVVLSMPLLLSSAALVLLLALHRWSR